MAAAAALALLHLVRRLVGSRAGRSAPASSPAPCYSHRLAKPKPNPGPSLSPQPSSSPSTRPKPNPNSGQLLLRPSADMRARVDEFVASHFGEGCYVGVHLRSMD